jgi:hypothetical protein
MRSERILHADRAPLSLVPYGLSPLLQEVRVALGLLQDVAKSVRRIGDVLAGCRHGEVDLTSSRTTLGFNERSPRGITAGVVRIERNIPSAG